MNILTKERHRPAVTVELGNRAESQIMGEHAGDHRGDRRAARHVDDRLVLDDVLDANGLGRVRIRPANAAIRRAGANRDDRRRARRILLQHVQVRMAVGARIISKLAGRDGPVHEHDVAAPVFLDSGVESVLGTLAGSGLQGVVIVQRDRVEDQPLDGRRVRTRQRFEATGALLEREPDYRGSPRLLDRRRNGADHGWRQRHHGRGGRAEFHESATADSVRPEDVAYGLACCHAVLLRTALPFTFTGAFGWLNYRPAQVRRQVP
jgi:hypothetical protein